MPGYKSPKYTKVQNQEMEVATLAVLANSSTPLTIEEICLRDPALIGRTPQKMTRVLGTLCEAGFAVKTKSKSKNRMVYAAISQLEDQGYDISKMIM